jgi:hypothetical protein
MNHDRLSKALQKQGFSLKQSSWDKNHFYAESVKRILSWWKQDESAVCVKSRRHNDEDDAMSDYSAGYFCKTIKDAVASLGE